MMTKGMHNPHFRLASHTTTLALEPCLWPRMAVGDLESCSMPVPSALPLRNSLMRAAPTGTKRLCHQRKRWALQNSLMRALQGPSSSVTRGNGERYRIPWCVPYRDQAALSPEETVSVTEFLDACLTGTKQLCHQRKRWALHNSLMRALQGPSSSVTRGNGERYRIPWCVPYRDQAALSPEETVSVTEFLDACLTGTKQLCHQRKRWALQNSLMRALQGPSSSVTRGNGERYRIPWCVPYRDQAALSPEETVSVTEFLDACLTGTKQLCHQRKRWALQNSLMRALQGPSSSVTRGNGERYRIPWCVPYRDQAALSPEETVSVTEFLDACLTGTKQLCHQRKRWALQNSLMRALQGPSSSVTRGNGECYRTPWCMACLQGPFW